MLIHVRGKTSCNLPIRQKITTLRTLVTLSSPTTRAHVRSWLEPRLRLCVPLAIPDVGKWPASSPTPQPHCPPQEALHRTCILQVAHGLAATATRSPPALWQFPLSIGDRYCGELYRALAKQRIRRLLTKPGAGRLLKASRRAKAGSVLNRLMFVNTRPLRHDPARSRRRRTVVAEANLRDSSLQP